MTTSDISRPSGSFAADRQALKSAVAVLHGLRGDEGFAVLEIAFENLRIHAVRDTLLDLARRQPTVAEVDPYDRLAVADRRDGFELFRRWREEQGGVRHRQRVLHFSDADVRRHRRPRSNHPFALLVLAVLELDDRGICRGRAIGRRGVANLRNLAGELLFGIRFDGESDGLPNAD